MLDFDGVDDFIETPDQGTPPQLTLEARINTKSTTTWQCIIERGSLIKYGWHFYVNSGNRLYTNFDGQSVLFTPTNSITTNTWHHAVAAWDGSTVRVYIDGTERASALLGSLLTTGGRVYIGIRQGSTNPFNGLIDEVRIYNRALSAEEIKLIYNSKVKGIGLQIHPANLVAYWPMDDFADGVIASGANTVIDRSRESNHGTPFGGPIGRAQEVLSYP